jgi:hypothetical protein
MKLQKTTWVLLIVAVLLGGIVYFKEIQRTTQPEEVKAQNKQLFDFQEKDVQELTIETQKETLKFERTKRANNPWQMKHPENVQANDAVVAFLLNLLVEGKSDRTFTISEPQKKEYGLDKPLATINLQLENGTKHQLVLGNPDFEARSLYAQIDPSLKSDRNLQVILVPQDFQYAIDRDLTEWKQPETTSQKPAPVPPPNSEIPKR